MPSATSNNSNSTKPGRQELKGLGPIMSTSRRSTLNPNPQVPSAANHLDTEPAISSKRQQKYERRIREALKDLESLGPIVTTSRLRSRAAHPNDEYIQSLRIAATDALPRGGLRTRSGHHYDRSF
jgi:hypothetical protein